ncbi:MAG: hypothetical protein M3070_17640, partial [Actinomycetota bacterium]|nr:hypothetical protein [Actinomycetota bacterium]
VTQRLYRTCRRQRRCASTGQTDVGVRTFASRAVSGPPTGRGEARGLGQLTRDADRTEGRIY